MGLDELKIQQNAFERWQAAGHDLANRFHQALQIVKSDVIQRSGLKLSIYIAEYRPITDPSPEKLGIHGSCYLTFRVVGLHTEVDVRTIACEVRSPSTGAGFVYYFRSEYNERETIDFEATRTRLGMPVHVSNSHSEWAHELWWDGPEDNNKLTSVILDAFAKTGRTSKLELARNRIPKKTQSGCALLLGAALVALSIVACAATS